MPIVKYVNTLFNFMSVHDYNTISFEFNSVLGVITFSNQCTASGTPQDSCYGGKDVADPNITPICSAVTGVCGRCMINNGVGTCTDAAGCVSAVVNPNAPDDANGGGPSTCDAINPNLGCCADGRCHDHTQAGNGGADAQCPAQSKKDSLLKKYFLKNSDGRWQ